MKSTIRIGISCLIFGTYGCSLLSQIDLREIPELVQKVRAIAKELKATFPVLLDKDLLNVYITNALIDIPSRLFGIDVAHLNDLEPEEKSRAVQLIKNNIAEVQRILTKSIEDEKHRLTVDCDGNGGLHSYITKGFGFADTMKLIPPQLANFYKQLKKFVADKKEAVDQLGTDTIKILEMIQESLLGLTHKRSKIYIYRKAEHKKDAEKVKIAIEKDIVNTMNTIIKRVDGAVKKYYDPFIKNKKHTVGLLNIGYALYTAKTSEINMAIVMQKVKRVILEMRREESHEAFLRMWREIEEQQE